MSEKQILDTLPECLDCNGERVITVGEYDAEELVDCLCVKNEKAAKEESLAE